MKWGIFLAAGVLAVAGVGFSCRFKRTRDEQALVDEQWRLIRQEGIPSTPAEIEALLPVVSPSANPAVLYAKDAMVHYRPNIDGWDDLWWRAAWEWDSAAEADVRRVLIDNKEFLDRYDQAVRFPHCRWQKKWEEGLAVLWPEFTKMKLGAKLLLLRGSLATQEGKSAAAIAEAKRCFVLASHLSEAPNDVAALVARAIRSMALHHLMAWAFLHPADKAYSDALRRLPSTVKRPGLRFVLAPEMIGTVSLYELARTPQGRKYLGVREDQASSEAERIIPHLQSERVGLSRILKGYRQFWAALEPLDESRVEQARLEIASGMISVPTAVRIFDALRFDGSVGELTARSPSELLCEPFLVAMHKPQGAGDIRVGKVVARYTKTATSLELELIEPKGHRDAKLRFPSERP